MSSVALSLLVTRFQSVRRTAGRFITTPTGDASQVLSPYHWKAGRVLSRSLMCTHILFCFIPEPWPWLMRIRKLILTRRKGNTEPASSTLVRVWFIICDVSSLQHVGAECKCGLAEGSRQRGKRHVMIAVVVIESTTKQLLMEILAILGRQMSYRLQRWVLLLTLLSWNGGWYMVLLKFEKVKLFGWLAMIGPEIWQRCQSGGLWWPMDWRTKYMW